MVIRKSNKIAFDLHNYRNIDKEMAWILPLLADRAALIRCRCFS